MEINKLKKYPPVLFLWNEKRRMEGQRKVKAYTDIDDIRLVYRKCTGREANLVNPQRYTEKLQWLKLFYRDPLIPVCTDKFEVREYLRHIGYGHLLNDLIAVYESAEDIDFAGLPQKFVLKGTHGSGWSLVCRDKDSINWFWWKKIIDSWMRQNLYIYGREWNYAELAPRVIIEKYLEDDSGELRDYKIFCMNGMPGFIQLDENRYTDHKVSYAGLDGTILDLNMNSRYKSVQNFHMTDTLQEAVRIAGELSRPFPHVRMDFYICGEKIYFGEFTFFDGSGYENINPDEQDYVIGAQLKLPVPNYNLSILERLHAAQ